MSDKIIACICEGSAEQAIMDILIENDAIIFKKEELLNENIIRTRCASDFETNYLRKNFKCKITVYRILDSRNERFKLSSYYKDKVEVINVITAPEIEMLIIHNEKKYKNFNNSRKKPSDFCKQDLRMKDVKSYKFVREYFSDLKVLVSAIKTYHEKANIHKGEKTLYDLLDKDNDDVKKYLLEND